jgi:hypothetical protein
MFNFNTPKKPENKTDSSELSSKQARLQQIQEYASIKKEESNVQDTANIESVSINSKFVVHDDSDAFVESQTKKREAKEAQEAQDRAERQAKRVKKFIPINEDYVANQAAKRDAEVLVIKEFEGLEKAENLMKDHIKEILEMNNIKFDSAITDQIIVECKKKFGEVKRDDIKAHDVLKLYYQIEKLNKYLSKQEK